MSGAAYPLPRVVLTRRRDNLALPFLVHEAYDVESVRYILKPWIMYYRELLG
jgi:hypothetical protein